MDDVVREYVGSDFDPPLSDDAVILLRFVQEKKRQMRRLRAEVAGIALGCLFAGVTIGLVLARIVG